MLGICFVFRLFYVAPETTARFSHFDDQSRSLSPPRRSRCLADSNRCPQILALTAARRDRDDESGERPQRC
jgi:hypothetical protein